MIKEKSFYRSLAAIALPIALQNIISFAVQMLDTIMVGKLGDYELSATSLANQPFFVFTLLGFGLASGGAVLISQYWGRGNVEIVRRIMGISVRAITVAAVFFMVVCQIFPTEIMSLMSKEAPVIELGASYLRVVSFSYIFNGMSSCYMNSLRAVENVKLSTFTYAISFLVNGTFNYLFIFGKCGFPELGVVGAAIGTVIARFVELAIVLVYSTFVENKVKFNFSYLFKREKELLPDYIRTSIPVVGSELAWSMGTVVQAAIIGNIGSVFVSANSIAGVLQQLAMVMMFGIGNAAAVEMGKTVGAGDFERAKKIGKTTLALALGAGIFACALIFLLRTPMLGLYNVSDETRELVMQITTVMGIIMIGSGVEIVSIVGILRGAGDTKFAFAVDCGCTWGIGVLLGYLAGFVWHLPVLWVYVCLRADLPVRIILCLVRIFRGKYIKNVTRDV